MNNGCEKRKVISIKYCRCFLISVIIGGLFLIFLDKELLCSLANGIKVHFELPFRSADNLALLLGRILRFSLQDIVILVIVFISAFMTSSFLPCYVVLSYNGISLGISLTTIVLANRINSGFPSIDNIVIYAIFEVAYSVVLLRFLTNSVHFSKGLARTLYFLLTVGLIIVLNFIYCFLIYIT